MHHSEIIINEEYAGYNPVQFGYEDCAPRHSFGPAVRSFWLLHYVVSGTGTFYREGRSYRVEAGEIFVIPPFLETYYEADGEHPWHYIWVGFTTERELPPVLSAPVIRCAGIGSVFEDMRRCGGMQSGKSAFLSSRIWEMMALLLEEKRAVPDHVEAALHCMRSEYMNGITVQEIADRMGLDRCYFSALFSRRIGEPPSQYLLNLRLEKAAQLMLAHGESPSVAAMSVGYGDIYNFSKMFKKKYGLSPRAYVRAARQE